MSQRSRVRKYPPKGGQLSGRYLDRETGEIVFLYTITTPVEVRVSAADLAAGDVFTRRRAKKQVV